MFEKRIQSAAPLLASALATAVLACSSASLGTGAGASQSVVLVFTSSPEAVSSGQTAAFAATVSGISDPAVTWAVQEPSGCGAISDSGVYSAPEVAAEIACHVVAASRAAPSVSDQRAVRVVPVQPSVTISISPTEASLVGGQSWAFSSTVLGTSDAAVSWSLREATGCGSVVAGAYTSPLVASALTCHVVATSHADPSKAAVAAVAVSPSPQAAAPTFSPAAGTYGGSVTVALASATSGAAIRYTTDGSAPSSSSTRYTTPFTLTATTTVRAIAQATEHRDSPISAAAYAITTSDVAVAITPATASATSGELLAFTATVTGTSNAAVTWSVEEASCGDVTTAGAYSAPTVSTSTTCHVRATSQAATSRYARATVTVSDSLDAAMATLASRAIYFGHQSVGGQIMAGVQRAVAASSGPKPTLVTVGGTPPSDTLRIGVWSDGGVGNNTEPLTKFDAFQAILLGSAGATLDGLGAGRSITFMKLCFVDVQGSWYHSHDAATLFAAYQTMVDSVRARRPNVRLVHLTMPLCYWDGTDNAQREAYNSLIRDAYGAEVFDLALLESTDPSGNGVAGPNGPYAYEGYTQSPADSCHLSTAGEDHLARALIQFLAN